MKKSKLESLKKLRTFQVLLGLFILYAIFACFLIRPSPSSASGGGAYPLRSQEELFPKSPKRPYHLIRSSTQTASPSPQSPKPLKKPSFVSGLKFREYEADKSKHNYSALHKTAKEAWDIGKKMFKEVKNAPLITESSSVIKEEKCKPAITMSGKEFRKKGNLMVIPCGLTLGSHITFVGKPHVAHLEVEKKREEEEEARKMVSQFMIELQGLKTVDGEEPPKILHYNPRLKGDWRGKPVIEQNTCYRMQWGASSRCEGWKSRADEETVDGLVKCERWINNDDDHSEESKTAWWLNRLIGRTKKVPLNWPYPFVENKLFVLTLSAGLEGYHVTVDGRHVTSFPYRTGFVLEDATGLSIHGDIDVHSIFAASLPTSHPSFAPQRSLEMSPEWQAPPLPREPAELFIGILSAGNHFAERMAVRKSWMSTARQNSNYVARFFVALHGRKEVNIELKKEAEFFGDIVIVPYMDSYDLVVLKTAAIFEYGVRKAAAKYIMKCDDDTFVRIDSVMDEVKKVSRGTSFYMGNMNYYHKPLRHGKWAVTYEEWPEEDYPPYANGPGYIVSADIAQFIMSEFENHTLRLFKMEDVSMGLWVEKFNKSKPVEYIHSLRYCQFGCIDDYLTAHYQSPRQMLCMWDKLQKGKPQCCNMR